MSFIAPRRRRPMNLSRAAFSHLAAALGLAVLSATALGDWSLTPADGPSQQGLTINTWNAGEGLSYSNAAGKLGTLATREIVSLTSKTPTSDAAGRFFKLTLRNGDVLFGTPAGASGQSLNFTLPEVGKVTIPFQNIGRLDNFKLPGTLPPVAAGAKDVVLFQNNDRLEGTVNAADGEKLQLAVEGNDTPMDLPLANVAAVVFGGAASPRTIPPLSVRLTFAHGSTLTVPLTAAAPLDNAFAWTINKLTFKDPAGEEHAITADLLAGIEVLGGRVAALTELDPAAEEQVTFLGTKWPVQVNKNAVGGPLRVARVTYPQGLGVHTSSTLAYDLDGTFETLSVRVGLDDSAAPYGEAKAAIVLDGKTLWQSEMIKPGELSPELSLPVKGGKRLELRALSTGRLDVQGRVDWLNVSLRRK